MRYGALLESLRGISWPARVPARGIASGTHVSRLRGATAEFTEYRAYRQGDDPRRLDWKLLARADRAFVRITHERATHPTLLVLDASASMLGPEGSRKWDRARELVVGLAALALGASDPAGVLVTGAPRAARPMRARAGTVADIARAIDDVAPTGDAPMTPVLKGLRHVSRLVLVTDLLGDETALRRLAGELVVRGADVTVAQVIARGELEPPATAVLARDPEAPDRRGTLSAETRLEYVEAFAAWRRETARGWRAIGARIAEVVDDEPIERAIRRVVAPTPPGSAP